MADPTPDPDSDLWQAREGPIHPMNMTDKHLANTVAYIQRYGCHTRPGASAVLAEHQRRLHLNTKDGTDDPR